MKKYLRMLCTASLLFAVVQSSHAGLLSALRDRISGDEAAPEQPAPAQQAQAEQQQAQSAPASGRAPQASGTTGRRTGRAKPPQPTPADPEKVKAGAKQLSREINTEAIPADLFRRYAGRWKGNFWVYAPSGKLEAKQSVSIECQPQGDGSMSMTTQYFDRLSNAFVVAERSTYVRQGDSVRVTIKRPTGETNTQTGRYNDDSLFLIADIKDGAEYYRERIDGNRYLLDGFGMYKSVKDRSDHHIFVGRFLKER